MSDEIDQSFIGRQEGFELVGYVPERNGNPIDQSGVTVAAGVDLGSMGVEDLEGLGITTPLFDKLYPYLGVRGFLAVNLLQSHPLELTADEANMLESAVEAHALRRLRAHYNHDVAPGHGWDSLSSPQKTVIFSVNWQYGAVWRDCPKFWKAVTLQDWPAAVRELRNFGDHYPTRRNAEAEYLEKGERFP